MNREEQIPMSYPLYRDPTLPSSLVFVNHLPHADTVKDREPVGSPGWRAVMAAQQNLTLAGCFAAHAHAYAAMTVPDQEGEVDRVTRLQIEAHHIGAMSGLTLALIAQDSYPISRQEYVTLALPALYEAATGRRYADAAPISVVQEGNG